MEDGHGFTNHCDECGEDYDLSLTDCPSCGKHESPGPSRRIITLFLVAILGAYSICGIINACTPTGPPPAEDAKLTDYAVDRIIDAGLSGYVYECTAETNGRVVVTLTYTREAMGGEVHTQDVAKQVASAILRDSSAVTSVAVRDADKSIIDFYSRP